MQGLKIVNNFVQPVVVANNTSWVIISKINMNEFAITDSRSDTKGVTSSLLSKVVGWLGSFAVEFGNSSSLMVKAVRGNYHSSCDMDTDSGSIELKSASLCPLVNVETLFATIDLYLVNTGTIKLGMNKKSLSDRSLVTSVSILEETIVEATLFALDTSSQLEPFRDFNSGCCRPFKIEVSDLTMSCCLALPKIGSWAKPSP